MSDTEDVEGFDKEAEKEKLRAQLEREEENRRSTQHMSELLLKGATMTNKHCDTCGDPLFRYEGQEFCPSCTQEDERAAQDATAAGDGAEDPSPPDEVAGGETRQAEAVGQQRGGAADAERRVAASTNAGTAQDATAQATTTEGAPTATGAVPEDVAGARDALARKLASLASRAEATDDVARSRELLAAAREAAEALAAIDRVR